MLSVRVCTMATRCARQKTFQRLDLGALVGHAGMRQKVQRHAQPARDRERDRLEHVVERVAGRAVVCGVHVGTERVQADAHRLQAGVDQAAAGSWAASRSC